MRDLVPLVQFKKREKHQRRIPPSAFFTFLKLYKCYQITQRITCIPELATRLHLQAHRLCALRFACWFPGRKVQLLIENYINNSTLKNGIAVKTNKPHVNVSLNTSTIFTINRLLYEPFQEIYLIWFNKGNELY